MKSNPLLANIPVGNLTPGNWADAVWFAQDFKKIPFNGTRQAMRATGHEDRRPEETGLYDSRRDGLALGCRIPPRRSPKTESKYRDAKGAEYFTARSGQTVRVSPRVFKRVSRRWMKRQAAMERASAARN